jgi:deazaflavin-dependent oxidoreductase (nitroreductase family)
MKAPDREWLPPNSPAEECKITQTHAAPGRVCERAWHLSPPYAARIDLAFACEPLDFEFIACESKTGALWFCRHMSCGQHQLGPHVESASPELMRRSQIKDTGGTTALVTMSDFTRWLYRGQRPNWIARIMNRASAAVASSGVTPNYLVTLEVTGRKSGRTVSLPVVVAVVDGQRYLVSMLGDNVQWVRNVRAAGGRAFLRSGGREEIQLEEVPTEQRAPILKAYLRRAPGARPHVPVKKDAALAEFEKIAAAFPVFRVTSNKAAPPRD